jgi:hypothetical protein
MRVPESRLRRQGRLLDRYWTALRRDRTASPPDGLEPHLADLATRLEQNLRPPGPTVSFADQLQRRIEAQASAGDERRTWSGPAIGRGRPVSQPTPLPHATDRNVKDKEYIMATSAGEPTPMNKPRWTREWAKIAAAIAAFVVAGLILALLLRDGEDDGSNVAAPSDATATTTQAVVPTATVTATPASPQEFSVTGTLDLEDRAVSFVTIEVVEWAPFGGSDVNAVTEGINLSYQDAGIESCWFSDPSVQLHHPDGSSENVSDDLANPTTVEAGDWLIIPSSVGNNCKNNQQTRSRSYTGTLYVQAPRPATDVPPSVRYELLAQGDIASVDGSAEVVLSRMLLEPGESMVWNPDWIRAVYVETGDLELEAGSAAVQLTHGNGETREEATAGSQVTLIATDGAVMTAGDGSTIVNNSDGTVSVIVFAVKPAK